MSHIVKCHMQFRATEKGKYIFIIHSIPCFALVLHVHKQRHSLHFLELFFAIKHETNVIRIWSKYFCYFYIQQFRCDTNCKGRHIQSYMWRFVCQNLETNELALSEIYQSALTLHLSDFNNRRNSELCFLLNGYM